MDKILNRVLTLLIIGIALFVIISKYPVEKKDTDTLGTNVQIDTTGKQIIEITAKGGYSPQTVTAKADVETILRIKTNNTFDCSSSLVIPKLNIRKNLPPTGTTELLITPQKSGTTIAGACAMGMYTFDINFN